MAWIPAERSRQEYPNHLQGLFLSVHPGANADHVSVVVLATELGCV